MTRDQIEARIEELTKLAYKAACIKSAPGPAGWLPFNRLSPIEKRIYQHVARSLYVEIMSNDAVKVAVLTNSYPKVTSAADIATALENLAKEASNADQ